MTPSPVGRLCQLTLTTTNFIPDSPLSPVHPYGFRARLTSYLFAPCLITHRCHLPMLGTHLAELDYVPHCGRYRPKVVGYFHELGPLQEAILGQFQHRQSVPEQHLHGTVVKHGAAVLHCAVQPSTVRRMHARAGTGTHGPA